jgi:hypothetical protein
MPDLETRALLYIVKQAREEEPGEGRASVLAVARSMIGDPPAQCSHRRLSAAGAHWSSASRAAARARSAGCGRVHLAGRDQTLLTLSSVLPTPAVSRAAP